MKKVLSIALSLIVLFSCAGHRNCQHKQVSVVIMYTDPDVKYIYQCDRCKTIWIGHAPDFSLKKIK
jgi:hypothetical protein